MFKNMGICSRIQSFPKFCPTVSMMALSFFLCILLLGLAAHAQEPAHLLRLADLSARDLAPGGGWALNSDSCSSNATGIGCIGCCPDSWDCSEAEGGTSSSACCPSGESLSAFSCPSRCQPWPEGGGTSLMKIMFHQGLPVKQPSPRSPSVPTVPGVFGT